MSACFPTRVSNVVRSFAPLPTYAPHSRVTLPGGGGGGVGAGSGGVGVGAGVGVGFGEGGGVGDDCESVVVLIEDV